VFYFSILTCVVACVSIFVIIIQSTHVVPKFIRSMSYSVICNDLIGLLKSLFSWHKTVKLRRCSLSGCKETAPPKTLDSLPKDLRFTNAWLKFIFNGIPENFTIECFVNYSQHSASVSKYLLLKDVAVPSILSSEATLVSTFIFNLTLSTLDTTKGTFQIHLSFVSEVVWALGVRQK